MDGKKATKKHKIFKIIIFLLSIWLIYQSCEDGKDNQFLIFHLSKNKTIFLDTVRHVGELHKNHIINTHPDTIWKFSFNQFELLKEIIKDDSKLFSSHGIKVNNRLVMNNDTLLNEFLYDSLNLPNDGIFIEYFSSRNKKTIAQIKNGVRHGSVRNYFEDGKIASDENFVNGFGVYLEKFDTNGNLVKKNFRPAILYDEQVKEIGDTISIMIFHPVPDKFDFHHYEIWASVIPVDLVHKNSSSKKIDIKIENVTIDSIKGIGELSFSSKDTGSYVVIGEFIIYEQKDNIFRIIKLEYQDGSNIIEFVDPSAKQLIDI